MVGHIPMDIFDKCIRYTRAKNFMAHGVYPYFMPLSSPQGPEITMGKKKYLMMGSNNYLGIADDPRMKQVSKDAIDRWGTSCSGSRLLNGTMDLHIEVEKKIAKFKNHEAALLFSTGYQTNLGIVGCLVNRGDYVILDKWDHASIMDGGRLSWGESIRYKHNDMEHLDEILNKIPQDAGKLIAVDGVFSMEGDIVNLPGVVELAKKYNARILLDDAHSTGVLGPNGRGTCDHFGLGDDAVDLIVGTCSKALASVGGFAVGSEVLMHFLQNNSRSMMFSAAIPPAPTAAISKAIDIIQEEPWRRVQLHKNADRLKKGLSSLGFDIGPTESPIVPIIIGEDMDAFNFWKETFDAGIFTNPVISPAVPPGRALIRVTLMATHTTEQVDQALGIFEHCGRKMGILPSSTLSRTTVAT